jgi:predicted O-linked N-acetylglucosamine transferase (SPINDLY family)
MGGPGSSTLGAARDAWRRGDAATAEAQCREALAVADDAAAWTLLGIILRQRDPVAAENALRHAIDLDSRDADARFHLGNLYREQERFAAAIAEYEKALLLTPGHPSLLNNLALALEGTGNVERAITIYQALLSSQPLHRQALGNLAHLLCRGRRHAAAGELCERYLRQFPEGDVNVLIDYGICQHHTRDHAGAEASFRRALALAPDDATILANLGSVLVDREDYEAAEPVLARAVACDPQHAYAIALLAYCRARLCAWETLATLHSQLLRRMDAGDDSINAFVALSLPLPAEAQLRIARRWASDLSNGAAAPAARANTPATNSKLRLGYVSSDFRTHALAFLLTEVWERHDRGRVETHAYSIGPRENSPLCTRIEAAFDHFADCADENVEQTAQRIRADGIDLLIDLNGYTTHARSEIFALRPAPVQLHWLGYLGTLGAEHIDYIITDRFATPADQQSFFTERFLYLPDCYCPSDTRRDIATRAPTREESGLPAQGFVFCCFSDAYKIMPEVFDVWMRLLAQVPDSVLWLSPGRTIAVGNLRREAARRGVDPARLVFAPRVPLAQHLARHAHADLFLDTMPYNAGTTANDALFMGLPVLTCAGATMANRVAGSQLHAIGLPELVTANLAEYEALALALATAPALLGGYRERLRANRETHPLFDMARFVQGLEDSLARVWRDYTARSST